MANARYVTKSEVNGVIDFNLKFMDSNQFKEFTGSLMTLYTLNLISKVEYESYLKNFEEMKNV